MTADVAGTIDRAPPSAALSAPRGRIAEIEALRGVAILMVLIEHMPLNLFYWDSGLYKFEHHWWRSAAGVDLFFAISGFVIARGLLPKLAAARRAGRVRRTLLAFWLRRIFRLWPAGWLWLAVPLIALAASNKTGAFGEWHANCVAARAAWFNVLNLHIGLYWRGGDIGMASPYWSLSLEEQFYVLLPLAALLFGRWLPALLIGLVLYQLALPLGALASMTRPGALAAGVLVAIVHRRWSERVLLPRLFVPGGAAGPLLLLGGIAALGFLFSETVVGNPVRRLGYDLGFGLVPIVATGLVHAGGYDGGYLLGPGAVRRFLILVGERSYTLYLVHGTAYVVARELLFATTGNDRPGTVAGAAVLLALALPLLLIATELTYRGIEVPIRRVGGRLSSKLESRAGDRQVAA